MIKRCYFFNFNYLKDNTLKYIQFTVISISWFPDANKVWSVALSKAKDDAGVNEVECTKFERIS